MRFASLLIDRLTENVKFFMSVIYAMFLSLIYKKPRRVIICYHSVGKQDVNAFEKQIAHLAKECRVVKASEIKKVKACERYVVAITFDDAFTSFVENAVPILRKHGLAAAVSVPTANLGEQPKWPLDAEASDVSEIVMTDQQIVELDQSGFEIFSHTASHPVLTEIEDSRLEAELNSSKRALEEIVGHEVVGISYPHGAYDHRVCKAAQKAGYKLGFTIYPSMIDGTTDYLAIGRFLVSPSDSLIKFKLKVAGAYQVTKYIRVFKQLIASFKGVVCR